MFLGPLPRCPAPTRRQQPSAGRYENQGAGSRAWHHLSGGGFIFGQGPVAQACRCRSHGATVMQQSLPGQINLPTGHAPVVHMAVDRRVSSGPARRLTVIRFPNGIPGRMTISGRDAFGGRTGTCCSGFSNMGRDQANISHKTNSRGALRDGHDCPTRLQRILSATPAEYGPNCRYLVSWRDLPAGCSRRLGGGRVNPETTPPSTTFEARPGVPKILFGL